MGMYAINFYCYSTDEDHTLVVLADSYDDALNKAQKKWKELFPKMDINEGNIDMFLCDCNEVIL